MTLANNTEITDGHILFTLDLMREVEWESMEPEAFWSRPLVALAGIAAVDTFALAAFVRPGSYEYFYIQSTVEM